MMSQEEKAEKLMKMSADSLLTAFLHYYDNFNPVDDESVENYMLCRAEVLRRLEFATK